MAAPAGSGRFKPLDEKHVLLDVESMLWSPKMDLIALANVAGEVVLHRLSWQKVWTLPALDEETKICSMAWRPDGKVLAVGYSSGIVQFCDVEDCSVVHSLKCNAAVTYMTWCGDIEPNNVCVESEIDTLGIPQDVFEDNSESMLPQLSQFNKTNSGSSKDSKKLKGQKSLNILLVATQSGILESFAFGVFSLGVIDLTKLKIFNSSNDFIKSATMTSDFRYLSLSVERSDCLEVYIYDCRRISELKKEIEFIAVKFGTVLSLVEYMEKSIGQVEESWEEILLDLDKKLVSLAEQKFQVCGGSLRRDFLRLLMFGKASHELTTLLEFELSCTKMHKLCASTEMSYRNIQTLLQKHLQNVVQAIMFHVTDLKGLAESCDKRWKEKLGLNETKARSVVQVAGSLMLKTVEVLQVIDSTIKDIKTFLYWLYTEGQKMHGDGSSSSFGSTAHVKISQKDLRYVANFLHENFKDECGPKKSSFHLEKVEQYLRDGALVQPVISDGAAEGRGNDWMKVVSDSSSLTHNSLLFNPRAECSLKQLQRELTSTINDMLDACTAVSSESFTYKSLLTLNGLNADSITSGSQCVVSQRIINNDKQEDCVYTVCIDRRNPQSFLLCSISLTTGATVVESRCCVMPDSDISSPDSSLLGQSFSSDGQSYSFLDLSFYDNKILSLLVQEDEGSNRPIMFQYPLSALAVAEPLGIVSFELSPSAFLSVNIGTLVTSPIVTGDSGYLCHTLDNVKACGFAVSGTRKVACVLLTSKRRLRLLLLDVEDEDQSMNNSAQNDPALSRDEASFNQSILSTS